MSGNRLTRFTIEGLFGPGNPTIDIRFRLDERVTLLHGRNGSGKTAALRLIHAILSKEPSELLRVPLLGTTFELSDGSSLNLEASPVAHDAPGFLVRAAGPVELPNVEQVRTASGFLETWRQRGGPVASALQATGILEFDAQRDAWVDLRSGAVLTSGAAIAEHAPESVVGPRSLARVMADGPRVRFIPVDRLHVRASRSRDRFAVIAQGESLARRLREVDARYREVSSELDATLLRRLSSPPSAPPSATGLSARLSSLKANEARIHRLGLLRELPEPIEVASIDPERLGAVATVLGDQEKKLAVFLPIADRAERLVGAMNERLAPKRLTLDLTAGYRVQTADGRDVPLHALSSGEQHQLVLFHELLFETEPGTLVLIDEPELSLHVTWQETLVDELIDIARIADLDFVLATHSPYIIGEHIELLVRLGDPA